MPSWLSLLLLSLGAAVAATIAVLAVSAFAEGRQANLRRARLRRFAQRASGSGPRPEGKQAVQTLALAESATPRLDRLAARILPGAAALQTRLVQTGRSATLGQVLVVMAAVTGASFVLATFGGAPLWLAAIGAVADGQIVPRALLKRWQAKRLKRFVGQFPDAIDLIVRALRAGLPLSEAIRSVSTEFAEPTAGEFRRVVGGIAIGLSLEDALWSMSRRIDSPELRFFVISIATQRQTGGNLGETLGNLADILRARSQLTIKIKAMTSEARTSAMVLGGLPFAIGLLLLATNPNYISPMLHDPRGWAMMAAGAGMMTIGGLIMAKLVSFEV
jgi:tight adherence protein B